MHDFQLWWQEYILTCDPIGHCSENEYGKPSGFMKGLPNNASVTHQLVSPTLSSLWTNAKTAEALLELTFPPQLHADFGCPAKAWVRIAAGASASANCAKKGTSSSASACVAATVSIYNKTATRLPEAFFVSSNPLGSGAGRWAMDKLGTDVDPLDVAQGASRGLHAVASGVKFSPKASHDDQEGDKNGQGSLFFGTKDAMIARWDGPLPFPTPLFRQPDLSKGLSYLVFDNIWNTNVSSE